MAEYSSEPQAQQRKWLSISRVPRSGTQEAPPWLFDQESSRGGGCHFAMAPGIVRATCCRSLDGVSISTNTIQRNDLAYAIYRQYTSSRAPARPRHRSLAVLVEQTPVAERGGLRTKIARLLRASKAN